MTAPLVQNALQESALGVPLIEAGRIERTIHAPLVRVWENVHDWEHLPHLHSTSFGACRLEDKGPWGWRARTLPPGSTGEGEGVVELVVDEAAGHYVSRVIEGAGAPMEIWTRLDDKGDSVDIEVRFLLPQQEGVDLAPFGQIMEGLYQTLWDEDEAMMQARHHALSRPRRGTEDIVLGSHDTVLAALPVTVESPLGPIHVDTVDGALTGWLGVCPHMLGPLPPEARQGAIVTCPWHGYRFDCTKGRQEGGDLALKARVTIVETDGVLAVRLEGG